MNAGLSIPMRLQAAQMRYPGAITLGFKTSATSLLKSLTSGPLEEKSATC